MAEIVFVTGGSGSGKSAYAEGLLDEVKGKKYYIATMKIYGDEGEKKIAAHRQLRAGKNFETVELPVFSEKMNILKGSFIIFECIGNLCANYLFDEALGFEQAFLCITMGIEKLSQRAEKIVIVSNDVFGDGVEYSKETTEYIRLMASVNRWIAKEADMVVEIVYGIPIVEKP